MDAVRSIVVGLHLATAHFGANSLDSVNPGVYARLATGPAAGLTTGAFRNSHRRQSFYGAWTWETPDQRFALTVGAVTGYPAARVMPLVIPSTRVELTERLALRIAFIPKPLQQGNNAGLHLSVERGF